MNSTGERGRLKSSVLVCYIPHSRADRDEAKSSFVARHSPAVSMPSRCWCPLMEPVQNFAEVRGAGFSYLRSQKGISVWSIQREQLGFPH